MEGHQNIECYTIKFKKNSSNFQSSVKWLFFLLLTMYINELASELKIILCCVRKKKAKLFTYAFCFR